MPDAALLAVRIETEWSKARDAWRELIPSCDATPFQRFPWLDAWYHTMGADAASTPVLVTVTLAATGELVTLIPLQIIRRGGLRVLQFADSELTDFNAPLLGPVRLTPHQHRIVWQAVRAALPPCDVAEFRKQPPTIAGRANPLVDLAGARTSPVTGNIIHLPATWAAFHTGLDRRVRMEFERSWRVFRREPTAEIQRITDEAEALRLLDTMDRQQRQRLSDVGSLFSLDHPAQAAFYRHDLGRRLADGTVILAAMFSAGETVAALYAITDKTSAVVLRISHGGKAWANLSPGRLVVHGAIQIMHDIGLKHVDLSIGEYDYKRRFNVEKTPLIDLVTALSWRGQAAATRHWAVDQLRSRPHLDSRIRRLFGQPARHLPKPLTT